MRLASKDIRSDMKYVRPALIDVCHALKNVRKILLAVSGGSDSVAMLHYIANGNETPGLYVATVDHGLRPESASEAEFVRRLCKDFELPHNVLPWNPGSNASSQEARLARYDLLARHALKIGATAIALGHTLNDQAETLVMRARRMNAGSGTRGLSGIPEEATHALTPGRSVLLLRPFLGVRRSELRDYLTDNDLGWVDDPSNENPKSERIQTRTQLNADNGLPDASNIARLAGLSARTRHWLNCRTSEWLHGNMRICSDGSITLDASKASRPIVENAFATLIAVAGGLEYRATPSKIVELVDAFQNRSTLRRNVGRVLVTISANGARFEREARNRTDIGTGEGLVDGRFFIDDSGAVAPFIKSLEQFRPSCDDPLYDTISSKLVSMTCPNISLHLEGRPQKRS